MIHRHSIARQVAKSFAYLPMVLCVGAIIAMVLVPAVLVFTVAAGIAFGVCMAQVFASAFIDGYRASKARNDAKLPAGIRRVQ